MKKKTIYWAPFLHFYQPPTQLHSILKKVCDESYRPLIQLFKEHPEARVTVNICAVLTQMLYNHGFADVITGLRELAGSKQVEFTGTSKFHAILPLIPEKEILRQIELNYKTNKNFFKETFEPKGFFPPEMCYAEKINNALTQSRYEWVLLSGVACNNDWPVSSIYKIENSGLLVFFRDDILSNKISFRDIDSRGFIDQLELLTKEYFKNEDNLYVITAMDAETFGHHIKNWEKLFLEEVYEELENNKTPLRKVEQRVGVTKKHLPLLKTQEIDMFEVSVESVTISRLLELFSANKSLKPVPSSWSSSLEDIKKGNPYPLWKNPHNPVHNLAWEHLEICMYLVKTAQKLSKTQEALSYANLSRGLLDRALHSCQFWWANKPNLWNINMVNKGLLLQEETVLNAYKSIELSESHEALKKECHYKLCAARTIENQIKEILVKD